jgi:hypothetical protein
LFFLGGEMKQSKISRREFIRLAGLTTGAAVLSACAAPTAIPEVVKETQLVEQIVKETQLVEVEVEKIVEVTPTPLPDLVTPQGKVLPADAAPLEKQISARPAPNQVFDTGDIYSASVTNSQRAPAAQQREHEAVPPWRIMDARTRANTEFVIRRCSGATANRSPLTISLHLCPYGQPALGNRGSGSISTSIQAYYRQPDQRV